MFSRCFDCCKKKIDNISYKYAQIIRRLQKLSDGHRDTVTRSYVHVGNKHKGLLDVQIEELRQIKICILDILLKVEVSFKNKKIEEYQNIIDQYQYMRELANRFNQNQIGRIRNDDIQNTIKYSVLCHYWQLSDDGQTKY